mgnify:CR=1 FL=1
MHRLLMLLAIALQHAIAFAPPPLRVPTLYSTRAASSLRAEPSNSNSDKAALTVDDSALGVNATIQERLDLFRRLAVPYFQQAEGAKLQFGLLLVLVLCQSGVSVIFSFVGRDFYSALSAKDLAVFQEKTANYAVGLAVATPLTVLYKFQRQRLALSWRQWMTSELAKQYYQDRAYYRVELDRDVSAGAKSHVDSVEVTRSRADRQPRPAPDRGRRRLHEGVARLLHHGAHGGHRPRELLGHPLLDLPEPLLRHLRLRDLRLAHDRGPGQDASRAGVLFFFSSRAREPSRGPHAVVGQNAQQLLKEADLRYSLVRLRENAESIAFYGGEAREAEEVGARLDRAVANKREILGTQRNLEFFTTAYTYLVQILPVLVVSPLYFAGTIELGVVTQSAAA